jgi:hypothetical protein
MVALDCDTWARPEDSADAPRLKAFETLAETYRLLR